MQVELRPIDSIKPYPQNPRRNDAAVDAVAKSIQQYGFRQPIVVDAGGVVVVGHTRLKAAQKLGMSAVPVHVATDLTPEKAKAYRLADNQTNTIADFDDQLLSLELMELKDLGVELTDLGWSQDDIDRLLASTGTPDMTEADDAPAVSTVAVTRAGDLWVLGDQRLLCGDSTNPLDVARVLDGNKAALCATDPPYLVDYTGERPGRDGGNSGGKDWSAVYKEIDIADADAFFRSVFAGLMPHLAPGAAIYCWHAHKRQADIDRVWTDLGILNHQQVIWVKPVAVFGRMFWHQRHEPCLMGWVKGSMPEYARDQSLDHGTVWEIDWEGKARIVGNEHPTQKPVEIFARPIRRHTQPGDIVFEPFSGSGSQIIAAEQLGRRCRAIELEPVFVDVAVRRWQDRTGKQAVLDGTGRTWEDLRSERLGAAEAA